MTLPAPTAPELSIVVPTLDEADNIARLLPRIAAALAGVEFEVIVVDDDSRDGTAERVQDVARTDARVRCLRRRGRRGLSSACLDGLALARGRYCAVIDADLQHDETLLPAMLARLRGGAVDVVVASRYVDGGAVGSWNALRHGASRCATALARHALGVGLRDPMSGHFMIRAECVRRARPRLSGVGFKLLLDLVASSPVALRIEELPYRFACRDAGRSKLGARVALAFLGMVARKVLARPGVRRFLAFCAVGSVGVGVHFAVLAAMLHGAGAGFPVAQTAAVLTSMTGNFALNNALTFRDRRLGGRQFAGGLLRFTALCSIGAMANVVLAAAVFAVEGRPFVAAGIGILVGALWNYGASATLVWHEPVDGAAAAERAT